jgi:hypothetical protein
METIKKQLKDIEDMIPSRFNFDFGKKEYTGIQSDSQSKYEISDMLGKKGIRWRISPTLELIIKYRDIVFENGRTYVVGKTKVRKTEARITDIISLFEYLQTTRNYAIFNNLLNVMLSFIIKDDKITNEISKLYTLKEYTIVKQEEVKLVNAFIYGIDDAFNVKVETEFEWYFPFITLIALLKKKVSKSSSSPPDKEKYKNKLIEEFKYGMAIWDKLILSLQYKYIMEHIHEYAATIEETQSKMKVIYERDNVDNVYMDGDVSDDVINDELRKELKSWMSPKYRFIRECTDSEETVALNAYNSYVRENEKRRHRGQQNASNDEEKAYCNYAEAVSINSILFTSRLFTSSRLHMMNITVPIWMNYDQYMSKIKEEDESKAKELAIAKEKYKRKTKSKQHFGGVDPGTLLVLGSMGRMYYKMNKMNKANLYKGSNVVYMYPTLNTIIQGVETKLFQNKLNIQILYSSIKKILLISYNQDLPEAYNTISIVSGSTRNTKKVMRHNVGKKGRVINVLDRTLLYKNKDLLKELYTNIKNGHRVKVSPPKSSSSSHFGSIGSPPKSSSSSHFGSIGSPPNSSSSSHFGSIGSPPKSSSSSHFGSIGSPPKS